MFPLSPAGLEGGATDARATTIAAAADRPPRGQAPTAPARWRRPGRARPGRRWRRRRQAGTGRTAWRRRAAGARPPEERGRRRRGQAGEVEPADRRRREVLAQVFGERVLPVDGADEALPPQRQRVAALGQHVVGLERVRRPEELEDVGVVDQLADALLPVLAAAEVVRVDEVLVAEELHRAGHGLDHLGVGVGVRREHLAEAPRARAQGTGLRALADAHAERELPDDDRADEDAHAAAGDGRGIRADAEAEVGPVHGLLPAQLDRGRVERGAVQPRLDQQRAAPPERPGAVGRQRPVGARLRAEHALGLASDLGQRIRFLRAALGGVREHEQPAPAVDEDGRRSVHGELDVLVHPDLVARRRRAVIRPGRVAARATVPRSGGQGRARRRGPGLRSGGLELGHEVGQLGRPRGVGEVDGRRHRVAQRRRPPGERRVVPDDDHQPGVPGHRMLDEGRPCRVVMVAALEGDDDDVGRLDPRQRGRPRLRRRAGRERPRRRSGGPGPARWPTPRRHRARRSAWGSRGAHHGA